MIKCICLSSRKTKETYFLFVSVLRVTNSFSIWTRCPEPQWNYMKKMERKNIMYLINWWTFLFSSHEFGFYLSLKRFPLIARSEVLWRTFQNLKLHFHQIKKISLECHLKEIKSSPLVRTLKIFFFLLSRTPINSTHSASWLSYQLSFKCIEFLFVQRTKSLTVSV